MAPLPAWLFSKEQTNEDSVVDVDGGHDGFGEESALGRTQEEDEEEDEMHNGASALATASYPNPYGQPNNSMQHMQSGTEVARRGSELESVRSEMIPKDGFYVCKPYKKEIIAQQLNDNSPGSNRRLAIIGGLRDLGVKVFIIEAKSIQTTADVLHHVGRVVGFVARENRTYRCNPYDMESIFDEDGEEEFTSATTASLGFQRCLLYQDKTGRLFNLILAKHSIGQAYKFEEYLDTFSNIQAVSILAILARSFTCIMEGGAINALKPAYLGLILGVAFVEEMSLSWVNSSMLIRSTPSVSAQVLISGTGADGFRKAVVLCLLLAGAVATTSTTTTTTNNGSNNNNGDVGDDMVQEILTVAGIIGACIVLLSNLGSRAWHFMAWRPLVYQGPHSDLLAWITSIGMGAIFPFMANRKIHVGGRAGFEHIIFSAVTAVLVFMLSGLDEFQQFAIVRNDSCNQDWVTLIFGIWWFASFVISLLSMFRMPSMDQTTVSSSDNEPLLVPCQASPVGFTVPSLPDYEMDPSLSWTGKLSFIPAQALFVIGLFLAAGFGLSLVWWGLSEWGDDVVDHIQNNTLVR